MKMIAPSTPAAMNSPLGAVRSSTLTACSASTASAATAAAKKACRPRSVRLAAPTKTTSRPPMPLWMPPLACISSVTARMSARQFEQRHPRQDHGALPLPGEQQQRKRAIDGGACSGRVPDPARRGSGDTGEAQGDHQHAGADGGAEHADEAQDPPGDIVADAPGELLRGSAQRFVERLFGSGHACRPGIPTGIMSAGAAGCVTALPL